MVDSDTESDFSGFGAGDLEGLLDHFADGANDSGSVLDISDVSSVNSDDLSDGWEDEFEAREREFSEETMNLLCHLVYW